ncbi:MAG: flagellar protein FlaG [Bacillota bacterium]|nr:flagellar protein FlaG [Bacillota bacterium]
MRVEGQGMARDFMKTQSDAVKPFTDQSSGERHIRREDSPKKVDLEKIQGASKKAKLEDVELATEVLNQAMKISNHHLEFTLHEKSGSYQVKVVDSETEEIIREIPPEEALDYAARVRDMLNEMIGLMVDEKI